MLSYMRWQVNRSALFLVFTLCVLSAPRFSLCSVPVIKFDRLQELMSRPGDTTYVFNFFATWCAPCKKEFPSFQAWGTANAAKKTKLIFVSLDFKSELTDKLEPYVRKRNVVQDVIL